MKKRRKKNRINRFKRNFMFALQITPCAIVAYLCGSWLWNIYKDDIRSAFNPQDHHRFLNNDKVIEQQEASVPFEEEDLIVNNVLSGYDEFTELNQEIDNIPDPSILPEEVFERTSSELFEMDCYIPSVNWDELNEANEQANAWIYIPDSNPNPEDASINLEVVQGDDNEYYLHHDINNEYSKYGTIFIDCRDNPLDSEMSQLSDVTVIYGHHMKSNAKYPMFNSLCNYKDQNYYEEWPYGIIIAENGEIYKIDFFAGRVINGNDESNVRVPEFVDESQFRAYFDDIISDSTFTSDCEIQYGDKIVALVTCSYEFPNARYVLYGRLTRQLTNEQEVSYTLKSK